MQAHPAGFVARLAAFVLDYLIISMYIFILTGVSVFMIFGPPKLQMTLIDQNRALADLLAFVTLVLPVLLYFTVLESGSNQATWGKRRMHLRVGTITGERLSWHKTILRSALKLLPWQLAHTCIFNIPGWPMNPGTPPFWVDIGLGLVWVIAGIYVLCLAFAPHHRTPYDWAAGSWMVRKS